MADNRVEDGPLIRGARKAAGMVGRFLQMVADPPEQVSDDVLLQKVRLRDAMVRLLAIEEFEMYRQHVREKIAGRKDALCGLPPDKFVGPEGIELKGKILGEQSALNRLAFAIADGEQAEKKLKERKEKVGKTIS
jgi:hypothetical protein